MSKYNYDTTLKELLSDDRAVAIIEENFGKITKNPMVKLFHNRTLRQLEMLADTYKVDKAKVDELKKRIFEL